jgi:hypothetical protein
MRNAAPAENWGVLPRLGIIQQQSYSRPNACRRLAISLRGARVAINNVPTFTSAASVGVRRCGSAAQMCVLRKARVRRSGAADEGTLAAAVPATSGHWRIGGGSAGCNEFLAPLCHRARWYTTEHGQSQSR